MCAEEFTTRDLASPQVQPVMDDGERGLLDLLLHVTDNHLRGRQLSKK